MSKPLYIVRVLYLDEDGNEKTRIIRYCSTEEKAKKWCKGFPDRFYLKGEMD